MAYNMGPAEWKNMYNYLAETNNGERINAYCIPCYRLFQILPDNITGLNRSNNIEDVYVSGSEDSIPVVVGSEGTVLARCPRCGVESTRSIINNRMIPI